MPEIQIISWIPGFLRVKRFLSADTGSAATVKLLIRQCHVADCGVGQPLLVDHGQRDDEGVGLCP